MKRFGPSRIAALAAALCVWLVPVAGRADEPEQAPGQKQGPMILERIHSGVLVAPDVKVTRVDGRTSEVAGGYGGWLYDKTFFVGGAGYWLASGNRDRRMAYGGGVVGWQVRADRAVGFGAKTLVGGGEATLLTSIQELVPARLDVDPRTGRPVPQTRPPILRTISARLRSDFFIAEPEANLIVNFARNVRLTGGVGYRWVGGARNFDSRLRGVSGNVALQIGGGS